MIILYYAYIYFYYIQRIMTGSVGFSIIATASAISLFVTSPAK
jgi:hypothetical protein